MLRQDQILFTYLHLAPDPDQRRDLVASGATCIAYETVTDAPGGLPLLAPMSRSRRPAVRPGGRALPRAARRRQGHAAGRRSRRRAGEGRGASAAASSAATPSRWRSGLGADVTVLDRNVDAPAAARRTSSARDCRTVYSTRAAIEEHVLERRSGDWRGAGGRRRSAEAGHRASMVRRMQPGSVLVDVAIDQGGCFETSRADDARRADLRR